MGRVAREPLTALAQTRAARGDWEASHHISIRLPRWLAALRADTAPRIPAPTVAAVWLVRSGILPVRRSVRRRPNCRSRPYRVVFSLPASAGTARHRQLRAR